MSGARVRLPEPVAQAFHDLGLAALDAARGETEPHTSVEAVQNLLERLEVELHRWLGGPSGSSE